MNVSIKGKRILVFGASSTIGNDLVNRCLKEGAEVVGTFYKNPLKCENKRYRQYKCDITSESDIKKVYDNMVKDKWIVDVLVNCIGITKDSPIKNMNMYDWKNVIDTNLSGAFLIIKGAISVVNEREAKIICISSVMGRHGRIEQANYSSSKAGLDMLAKVAAMELAKKNITVNVVCPGFISTKLNNNNVRKKQDALRESFCPIDNNLKGLIDFLVFMISDCFNNITGQTFIVDSRIMGSK